MKDDISTLAGFIAAFGILTILFSFMDGCRFRDLETRVKALEQQTNHQQR